MERGEGPFSRGSTVDEGSVPWLTFRMLDQLFRLERMIQLYRSLEQLLPAAARDTCGPRTFYDPTTNREVKGAELCYLKAAQPTPDGTTLKWSLTIDQNPYILIHFGYRIPMSERKFCGQIILQVGLGRTATPKYDCWMLVCEPMCAVDPHREFTEKLRASLCIGNGKLQGLSWSYARVLSRAGNPSGDDPWLHRWVQVLTGLYKGSFPRVRG